MFFRKENNIEINQIKQNNEVNLFVGDSFGLLVDEFWFSIQPSDEGNDVIDGLHENTPTSTAGTKRRTSSDSEPDSTNKKVKTEPNEYQEDNIADAVATNEEANEASNGLSNGDLHTTLPFDATNEMPSTSAPNISQNQSEPTVAIDRPIVKAEPLDSDEIEHSMPTVKTEPMSQEASVDSSTTITVKTELTEVKTEPADNENGNGDDDATTSSGNPTQRNCCRYGIRCYR